VLEREKWTVQDRKKSQKGYKKSQKGYTSPIWAEAPNEAIYIKNYVVRGVHDVITCARFQNQIPRGYDLTAGPIFHFAIDFLNGPYNSAALLRCL